MKKTNVKFHSKLTKNLKHFIPLSDDESGALKGGFSAIGSSYLSHLMGDENATPCTNEKSCPNSNNPGTCTNEQTCTGSTNGMTCKNELVCISM